MVIEELVTLLGFEATDKEVVEAYKRNITSTAKSIVAMGAVAATAATGFAVLAVQTANQIEKQFNIARITKTSYEELQKLSYAAEQNGSTAEAMSGAMQSLSKVLGEAARGTGRAKKALDDYGLSAVDSRGKIKSSTQFLGELADRFTTLTEQQQVDLATKVGIDPSLILLLKQGSANLEAIKREAESLGFVLSDESAQAADDFGDSIARLRGVLVGLRNSVLVSLYPALTQIIDGLKDWYVANREVIRQNMTRIIKALGTALSILWDVLKGVGSAIQLVIDLFGGWETVIKLVTAAMVVMLALQLGNAILYVVAAVSTLIGFLRTASLFQLAFAAASVIAQASLLLIPIAIGLVAIAIGLLLEDLYTFFTGGESIIGQVVAWFTEAIPRALEYLKGKLAELASFMAPILGPLGSIIGAGAALFSGGGPGAGLPGMPGLAPPDVAANRGLPLMMQGAGNSQQFQTTVQVSGFDGNGRMLGEDIARGLEEQAKRSRRNTTGAVQY